MHLFKGLHLSMSIAEGTAEIQNSVVKIVYLSIFGILIVNGQCCFKGCLSFSALQIEKLLQDNLDLGSLYF